MADRAAHRAATYRRHARELADAAQQENRFNDRRRHLLDLATTYRRAADRLAPQPQADDPDVSQLPRGRGRYY